MDNQFKNRSGYVYILSNPSMPNMVKIGRSQNDPKLRAANLQTILLKDATKYE